MAIDKLRNTSTTSPVGEAKQTEQQPQNRRLASERVAGEKFEAGRTSPTSDRDPAGLTREGGLSPELLARLGALTESFAPVEGERSAPGDVDIDVESGPVPLLPTTQTLTSLGEIFSGTDLALQRDAAMWLRAALESGRLSQRHACHDLFGAPFEVVASKLEPVLLDVRGGEPTLTEAAHAALTAFGTQIPPNPNPLVQWVMRQAYLETTADLAFYAAKVAFFNDLKGAVRDELSRARDADPPYPTLRFNTDAYQGLDAPLVLPDDGQEEEIVDDAGMQTYIRNQEETLQTVGDDAQLANVDLQNVLQKQQQTLQSMSNMSKLLHDTALAVSRKLGG